MQAAIAEPDQAGTFTSSASPEPGATSFAVLAPWLRPGPCSSGLLGQATDLAVTEAVVDEAEQLPCRRHPGGHRPPALLYAPVYAPERRADRSPPVVAGDCCYGGPAHERRALLGDVAPVGLVVWLAVRGRQPGPTAEWRAEPKRLTSPTSATKMAAIAGPTPFTAWTAL